MQRRTVLRRSGASLFALPALGSRSIDAASGTAASSGSLETADSGYEPLGQVAIEGAAEAVVGDDGEIVYLATTTGFAIVDVSDPGDPELLFQEDSIAVDGDPLLEVLDVKVDGDRLVVPGPANRTSASGRLFHGFCCYDVSEPAEPALVGQPYETGFHIHNCYLDGETLYVVANDPAENPLVVYDVGAEIEEIGRWSLLEREPDWGDVYWLARYLHDVYVHDDIAYLAHWNAGTYLLDVADPSEPEYLSHVAETSLEEQLAVDDGSETQQGLPGNDHYSAVDETGDLLAVGREAWATGGDEPDGPGGIDLYDVSEPEAPVERGSIAAPEAVDESYGAGLWTTAHNFELRDGRLYASWYRGGVSIHDVTDPDEPEAVASWRDPHEAGFWTARVAEPGETFVASSTPAIPNSPTEGALYTFPIEAGEQVDPPSLTDPDAFDLEPERRTEDDEDAGEETAQSEPTAETSQEDDETEDDDSRLGFTAGAVGVASGAVALEVLRRRNRQ
ncbi:LVIVD repeat-containing protein [Halobiforma nitratireducens]|uniref:LVIVD repeat-containing protein n=1 Tax=Halobiforma nitratireducens JCM 10879 TaxID=1227454 RepID=M0M5Z7_9EURY|nr:LVIVD repeat-containing protein [Halobiforma nitratireducens]EMA40019.1 LVIVD repeat-containing protein [Halobiforma nitratireducens JCM 10879]